MLIKPVVFIITVQYRDEYRLKSIQVLSEQRFLNKNSMAIATADLYSILFLLFDEFSNLSLLPSDTTLT
jgi:hypothetical protein